MTTGGGGNGVFAARDFVKDEIVELVSFFVPIDYEAPTIMNSVLNDYVYGYLRFVDDDFDNDNNNNNNNNNNKDETDPTATENNSNINDNNNHHQNQQHRQRKSIMLSLVLWGLGSFFNHHPTSPNLEWKIFGGEPHSSHIHTDDMVQAVGFVAKRDIQAGEELFVSYGVEDGGTSWFRNRHLTMAEASRDAVNESTTTDGAIPPRDVHLKLPTLAEDDEQWNRRKQTYCSKMYAGLDRWVYEHRLRHIQPMDFPYVTHVERLAPPPPSSASSFTTHESNNNCYNDPEYPWAIAKVPISAGERIELAPALVMDRALTDQTPLAPLVYYWNDLTKPMQEDIRRLRRQGYYVVQYQDESNQWKREDRFSSLEQSVILPLAGRIGRIQRVGDDPFNDDGTNRANCYMKIHAAADANTVDDDDDNTTTNTTAADAGNNSKNNDAAAAELEQRGDEKTDPFSTGNAGIMLELIATRDIKVGERIRINLPLSGTLHERILLYQEMQRSGQVYAPLPSSSSSSTTPQ